MFNRNFSLLEERTDDMFGQVSVYENKNTKKVEIYIKTLSYSEEQDMNQLVVSLKNRIINPIPNLLSVYHLEEVKMTNAFCGSAMILRIYFEYLEKSLKEEMRKRRKHKNYFFS